jgi:hypothetical protein
VLGVRTNEQATKNVPPGIQADCRKALPKPPDRRSWQSCSASGAAHVDLIAGSRAVTCDGSSGSTVSLVALRAGWLSFALVVR